MSVVRIKLSLNIDGDVLELDDSIDLKVNVGVLGTDPKKMINHMFNLFRLSLMKGKSYGDSWKRHGELFSVIPNLLRKMDRITHCASNQVPAGKVDGCGDLAVYSLLYLQWLQDNHPKEYQAWMSEEVEGYIAKYR